MYARSALLSQEGSVLRSNHARGGSQAALLQDFASEPPRRFAPPLLTQEGNLFTPSTIIQSRVKFTNDV